MLKGLQKKGRLPFVPQHSELSSFSTVLCAAAAPLSDSLGFPTASASAGIEEETERGRGCERSEASLNGKRQDMLSIGRRM